MQEARTPVPRSMLLLAASRVHLEDDDAQRIRERLKRDLDWNNLLLMARRNGVTALLTRHLNVVAPGVIPQDVLDQLRQSVHKNSLRNSS